MASDKTASYSVKVDTGDSAAKADETADALAKLLEKITTSKAAISQMSDSFRSLRGSTDDVKAAKDKLKAGIEAERSSVSAASLELIKQGSSYRALSDQAKAAASARADAARKAGAEQAKAEREATAAAAAAASARADAARKAGAEQAKAEREATAAREDAWRAAGRLDLGREAMAKLRTAFSTTGGAALVVGGLIVGAMTAVVAAVGAAASAVARLSESFVRWLVESALANRQAALQREAWTGTAEDALHLGHQLDALAAKVATPREALEKLAGSQVKALNNSLVSGQGIVDTMNAVAQASAAMGDEVGAKLGEMVARFKNTGRVTINPFELQGTGLKIQDIGAQLAKSMHVGAAQATAALQTVGVPVNDFAKALREASEVRFGNVNILVRLGEVAENFRKRLMALTKDVKLDALLEGFEELSKLFDQSTYSGYALKQIVTLIGNGLGPALRALVPIAKVAFIEIEIGAVSIAIAVLKARNAIRDAFAGHKDVFTMADALNLVKRYIEGIAIAAVVIITVAGKIVAAMARVGLAVNDARKALGRGWDDLGVQIINGITGGLLTKIASLKGVMGGLGEAIKSAFKEALGIASPSKVFERYGQDTAEGYERGARAGAPRAQSAIDDMAPRVPAARGAGPSTAGGSGRPTIALTVQINVTAGAGGDAIARAIASDSVLGQLTKAIEDAAIGLGIAVQAEPTS